MFSHLNAGVLFLQKHYYEAVGEEHYLRQNGAWDTHHGRRTENYWKSPG